MKPLLLGLLLLSSGLQAAGEYLEVRTDDLGQPSGPRVRLNVLLDGKPAAGVTAEVRPFLLHRGDCLPDQS